MKKWNKPELLSLGVENTFEENCDCGVIGGTDDVNPAHIPGIGHHCHDDWGHIGIDGFFNDHKVSKGCKEHSYCCCYTAPTTAPQPQS